MRHGKKVNHLGRTSSHRHAMLSNMATSLILHKRISTTVAKAKSLRKYIEPLITKAKDDSTHSRRIVFSYLQDKNAVTELFREISQKVGDRSGGYTRILRTGFRVGDAAEMCIIELVDYNENYTQNKGGKQAKSKTTRRGRSKRKTETPVTETEATESKKQKAKDDKQVKVIEEAPATVDAEIVEEIPEPEVAVSTPEVDISTPKVDVSTPKVDISTPKVDISTPEVDISTPEVDISTPEVAVSTPKVDISTPEVDISTPKVDISTPKVGISTPEVDISTPKVDISTPEKKEE